MKTTVTFTEYRADGDEVEHELPGIFRICPACSGRGTTTRHVEPDCGLTREDFEEDPDFYFSGFYDRPCPECIGHAGRVLVVDRKACDKALLRLFDRQKAEDEDYQALVAAEQRMGA